MTDDQRRRLEDAVAKLDVLGTTEAVGMEMVERGIKARPSCTTECVLAEFLTGEVGTPVTVAPTHRGSSQWYSRLSSTMVLEHHVMLPVHVGRLADEFDRGLWPQLVKGFGDD